MLQNHGWADTRQGPDLEEDPQVAANLLQVQKLSEDQNDPKMVDILGLFIYLFIFAQRCIHLWTLLFFCNTVVLGIFLIFGHLGVILFWVWIW